MSTEAHRDYAGAKLGMWLFLFTEIVLFGGLFVLYSVYLYAYPAEFARASEELSLPFGAINTLVLLTSSLCIASSITAMQKGDRKLTLLLLAVTVVSALVFLINKAFEWTDKFSHGIYLDSPQLLEKAPGEIVFFGLYYITTGLHGLHVVIGMALIIWVFFLVRDGRVTAHDYIALENSGLYWHLVDLIWIFIFPLYYLIL